MKFSTTKKITLLLSLLFIPVLVFLVYWNSHIWESANAVREKYQALATEAQSTQFLGEIEMQIEEITKISEAFDKRLIDRERVVDFIKTLESIGRASGVAVKIQTVDIQDGGFSEADGLVYNLLNISLQATGGLENVNMFLQKFEAIPHRIGVNFLRLSSNKITDGKTSETVWMVDMDMSGITN